MANQIQEWSYFFIAPSEIRFSPASVSEVFAPFSDSQGRLQQSVSILDTVRHMALTEIPDKIESIDVVWLDVGGPHGGYWSVAGTFNQRLVVWRLLAMLFPNRFRRVNCRRVPRELCRITCGAMHVEVRPNRWVGRTLNPMGEDTVEALRVVLSLHSALQTQVPTEAVLAVLKANPRGQASLGWEALILIASSFAKHGKLRGLAQLVLEGIGTLDFFVTMTRDILSKETICFHDGDPGIEASKVLRVLRVWHHGCILWSGFIERSLHQKTTRRSAHVIRTFLIGGDCSHGSDNSSVSFFGRSSTQLTYPSRPDTIAVTNSTIAPAELVPDVTLAIMENIALAQSIERSIVGPIDDSRCSSDPNDDGMHVACKTPGPSTEDPRGELKIPLDTPETPEKMKEKLASSVQPLAEDSETPVQIPPDEAAAIQRELWASSVQRLATLMPAKVSDAACSSRQVMLLEFSRHPRELEEALLNSSVAESARVRAVDTQPDWARGAMVFIDGVEPADLPPGVSELGPMHVVIYADDEEDLLDELVHLPYNIRKIKPAVGRRYFPDDLSLMDVSSQSTEVVEEGDGNSQDYFVIEYSSSVPNTFIHFASRNDTRSVRSV